MENDTIQITVDRKDLKILLGAAYTLYYHTKDNDILHAVERIAKASDLTSVIEWIRGIINDTSKS